MTKDWTVYLPSKWEEVEDMERRVAMEDAMRKPPVKVPLTILQDSPRKEYKETEEDKEWAMEEKKFMMVTMEKDKRFKNK